MARGQPVTLKGPKAVADDTDYTKDHGCPYPGLMIHAVNEAGSASAGIPLERGSTRRYFINFTSISESEKALRFLSTTTLLSRPALSRASLPLAPWPSAVESFSSALRRPGKMHASLAATQDAGSSTRNGSPTSLCAPLGC
jgi:hypothetical protein